MAAKARQSRAARRPPQQRFLLRLNVTGATPRNAGAIENVKRICEEQFKGRYELLVGDVYQQPVLAKGEQVFNLEGAEHPYRVIFETMGEGAVALDPDGTILYGNNRFADMVGVPLDGVIGRTLHDFVAPEWAALARDLMEDAVRGDTKAEIVLLAANGGRVPAHLSAVPLRVNEAPHVCVVATDLRKVKEAEEARRRSEERLRIAVETMPDPFIILSAVRSACCRIGDFRCDYANEAARQQNLGHHSNLVGARLLQSFPALRKSPLFEAFVRVAETGLSEMPEAIPWSQLAKTRLRAGKLFDFRVARLGDGLAVSWTDVTERAQAEQTRAQLAALVTSSHDAVIGISSDGRIRTWNAGAERIYGYAAEEAVGRPATDLAPPHGQAEVLDILEKVRRGKPVEARRTLGVRKDGRPFHASLSVSPIRGADGKVVGASWICRDVTKQLQIDAAVLAAAEEERQRIGRDLHDSVGQQLTAITFLCKMLEKRLAEQAMPLAADAAAISQLAAKAVAESKAISRGLCPLPKGPEALMSGLNELAANAKALHGVACRFHCPKPVLIRNETTAMHLYRIAQEALSNAVRHGRARKVQISLTCSRDGKGHCVLSVADDGKGFREPPAGDKKRGKGLDIMADRARSIGGTLRIEGRPRRGTVVECTFPDGKQ